MKYKSFRTTLLFTILCVLGCVCRAQNYETVRFAYDDNGNREAWIILVADERGGESSEPLRYVSELSDAFGPMEVKLYPNPTQDKIMVAVNDGDADGFLVRLYTLNGIVLEEKELCGSSLGFDLSQRTPGVYLVEMFKPGVSKTWKVLKRQ